MTWEPDVKRLWGVTAEPGDPRGGDCIGRGKRWRRLGPGWWTGSGVAMASSGQSLKVQPPGLAEGPGRPEASGLWGAEEPAGDNELGSPSWPGHGLAENAVGVALLPEEAADSDGGRCRSGRLRACPPPATPGPPGLWDRAAGPGQGRFGSHWPEPPPAGQGPRGPEREGESRGPWCGCHTPPKSGTGPDSSLSLRLNWAPGLRPPGLFPEDRCRAQEGCGTVRTRYG